MGGFPPLQSFLETLKGARLESTGPHLAQVLGSLPLLGLDLLPLFGRQTVGHVRKGLREGAALDGALRRRDDDWKASTAAKRRAREARIRIIVRERRKRRRSNSANVETMEEWRERM